MIDAIDVGEPAGTILCFEGKALQGLPGKASVHQWDSRTSLVALQLLGESPGEVVVFGMQPDSTEWSAELTQPVANAIPLLVESVIEQLKCWKENESVTWQDYRDTQRG